MPCAPDNTVRQERGAGRGVPCWSSMACSDAIEPRLDQLLEHVPRPLVRAEGTRVSLDVPEPGLPLSIEWSEREIAVSLSGWRHAWSLAGDDDDDAAATIDEAIDLVGAGLFGRARVRVHMRGTQAVRWDVEFFYGQAWSHHATVRSPTWRSLLRRRSVEILMNRFELPKGMVAGALGRLPFAPWVGMLSDDVRAARSVGELAVDGVLDLHPFSPKEVAPLVRAYIDACLERGITQLRIIHGKGIGHLRRTVHALLRDHPAVAGFRLGGHAEGSWGATIVDLRAPGRPPHP
jgi:hypothetical protein